jgi:alpha/beta hydrolase fold
MSTVEERRVTQLDPHILDFLKGLEAQGGPPLYTLSPADARNVLLSVQRSVNVTKLPAELAKARSGPKIDFQILFYPVTDANLNTQSYQQFGEAGYWLTREAMKWFWDSYAPESVRNEPTISPLRASLDQLRGLPPALIITDENDVLRDEGEAYAHKLMAAGVPVAATRYLGAIHDFVMLNPITGTPPARAAIAQVNDTSARSSRTKLRSRETHVNRDPSNGVYEILVDKGKQKGVAARL